jgi:catechol 2,3-dioxygenase-like lactoylglutathione lyase family enzyme
VGTLGDVDPGFVTALDHVQVAVPRGGEERARAFYRELLGMEELPKPEVMAQRGGLWLRCGAQQLHIGAEESFVPAKKAHPALRVRRFDELLERLAAAGLPVRRDGEIAGVRRAFTEDFHGNRVELIEA